MASMNQVNLLFSTLKSPCIREMQWMSKQEAVLMSTKIGWHMTDRGGACFGLYLPSFKGDSLDVWVVYFFLCLFTESQGCSWYQQVPSPGSNRACHVAGDTGKIFTHSEKYLNCELCIQRNMDAVLG